MYTWRRDQPTRLTQHLSYSVVTTVRSQEKADKIKEGHPNVGKDKLDFAIVKDIAVEGAFEDAVKSDPPFEAVVRCVHTHPTFSRTEELILRLLASHSKPIPLQRHGHSKATFGPCSNRNHLHPKIHQGTRPDRKARSHYI